jgi:hypothetical protein
VVEGGTLLRCYTSQRGIEGSNPSSSAPEAPRLQEERNDKEMGRERYRPLLHQRVHQRGQDTLFPATNAAFAIVYLYPPHYKLWSPSRCRLASLNQSVSLRLLLCRLLNMDFREFTFHALG